MINNENIMEILNPIAFLEYSIFFKAFVGSLLSAFVCSFVGVYVFLRKMSFIGAGLAHIAFAGIAFGLFVGSFPILWGFIFAVVASMIMWFLKYKGRLSFDATIGILFATSMGLGVLFLGISGKYKSQALSYLFGSPLMVNSYDIYFLIIASLVLTFLFVLFWREIYLTIFSEDIAKASGYPVELITFFAMFFLAVAVVSAMKAVGALLVFSLLVMPPAAAYELSNNFFKMVLISILFGILAVSVGIFISFMFDLPSGSTITLFSFFLFMLSYIKSYHI